MSASWYAIRNISDKTAEIAIYDEIGLFGVTAKKFTDSISSLGNRRLTVRIHSPGGEIFAGNAIYNSLRRYKGGVDVAIDGLAASMASVVAMAGEKRSMAGNAMLMVHNPWTVTLGGSSDLRKEADLMDTLKETIVSIYAHRTGLERGMLSDMMDEETWMTAQEALDSGFVTDITEEININNSFKSFDISRFAKAPANFMAASQLSKFVGAIGGLLAIEEPTEEKILEELKTLPAKDALEARDAALAERVAEITAFTAKLADLASKISELEKECNAEKDAHLKAISDLNAEKKAHEVTLEQRDNLKRSFDLMPASVIVPAPAKAEESKSVIDQYNSLQGEDATAFYRKHQDELRKFINKPASN